MPKSSMGRSAPRRHELIRDGFRWDAPWLGTIVHSHVPPDVSHPDTRLVRPLQELLPTGRRDALSLLGQYAAHLAFLRFAGIGNSAFEVGEWGVLKERGRDPRLIRRLAGPVTETDEMLPVTLLQQFSETVGAPRLDILRASWVRPEAVFAEVLVRLHSSSGDTSSLRRSAWGAIRSPGPAILKEVLAANGLTVLADEDAAISARALGDAVTIVGRDANPLENWSAVSELIPEGFKPESETALAETILANLRSRVPVLVVENWRSFDPLSRRVVRLLVDAGEPLSWILPRELASIVPSHRQPLSAEATRCHLLSTSVVAGHALLSALGFRSARAFENWCTAFTASSEFEAFVREGSVGSLGSSASLEGLEEPIRSFVRALAMLGLTFEEDLADALLTALGFPGRVEDVLAAGVLVRGDDAALTFVSESHRDQLIAELDPALRRSIASIAANLPALKGDTLRRIAMLVEAGRTAEAEVFAIGLDREQTDPARTIRVIPRATAAIVRGSPHVAAIRCRALIDLGRYADAARESEELEGSCGRYIRALIARRLGDYGVALDSIGSGEGETCSFDEHLLRGELHRLKGHHESAREAFRRARAAIRAARDRGRLAYEEALLAFDRGMQGPEDELPDNPYYEARYLFYEAAGDGDLSSAIAHARTAIGRATTIPERVDAELDLVFALFLAGDWDAARQEARAALVTLEETQGDRAAAGILFTLAFLCADDGQWMQAEQKIARLQLFYDEHEDERRAKELDLLRAHLALCRLETAEAERLAEGLLRERLSAEMREAAALILDEIGWMRGELIAPHSSGESQCIELTNRHLVFVARTSHVDQHEILNPFWEGLCRWESRWRKNQDVDPPRVTSRSEKLALLRSMVALNSRRQNEKLEDGIERLAAELGTRTPLRESRLRGENGEMRILRLVATEPLPLDSGCLDVDWRLIAKSRAGRWTQWGSLPPLTAAEADQILENPAQNWVRCGARTLMSIDGLEAWPEDARQVLAATIESRMENLNLRRLVAAEPPVVVTRAEGMIGESSAIRETIARIEPASRRDVAVCIEGESGTGKELIAKAIHERSDRRAHPFMAINCAALPENLIESELFGCVRGAFTGADRDRKGLIEATDAGTLFLDEIAEMALPAQAKLLRFLQEREFRRVGGTVSRHADVRIIAATNRRLDEAVDRGEFRDDLFYRIRGIEIQVPPLRDRGADVLLLAKHFLRVELDRHGSGPATFSEDVEEMLLTHSWPGNVRELQQTVRAAHALAGDGRIVTPDHLPERMRRTARRKVPTGSLNDEITRFRRGLIERALEAAEGNQSRAAKQLGVTRQALAYQIRELGILVEKRR